MAGNQTLAPWDSEALSLWGIFYICILIFDFFMLFSPPECLIDNWEFLLKNAGYAGHMRRFALRDSLYANSCDELYTAIK